MRGYESVNTIIVEMCKSSRTKQGMETFESLNKDDYLRNVAVAKQFYSAIVLRMRDIAEGKERSINEYLNVNGKNFVENFVEKQSQKDVDELGEYHPAKYDYQSRVCGVLPLQRPLHADR